MDFLHLQIDRQLPLGLQGLPLRTTQRKNQDSGRSRQTRPGGEVLLSGLPDAGLPQDLSAGGGGGPEFGEL